MMRSASFARLPTRRFCPRVEALESRDCPSGVSPAMPGAPPTIQLMTAASGPHQFTLTGHVSDYQPAGLTVQFSGAYAGSVQTDTNGDFTLAVDPENLGAVSASVTDAAGLASNVAQAVFASMAPTITSFTASSTLGHVWVFSGHVTDEYAAGLKITFGGAVAAMDGLSTTVDADGNFSFTVEIPDGQGGGVSAQTTDWWGLASNVAICYVPPTV